MSDQNAARKVTGDDVRASGYVLIKREGPPGFLAVANEWSPIRFGVEGATEAEAIAAFEEAREQWARLTDLP